jgi:uncharacterized protein (TIGR02246 family)
MMRTLTIAIGAAALLVAAPRAQSQKMPIQDIVEIQQLYAHYAVATDTNDKETLAKIYTADAMFTLEDKSGAFGGGNRTFPALSASAMQKRERPDLTHYILNVAIDPHPQGARVTQYIAMMDFQKEKSTTAGAFCDDLVVKDQGNWRIKKRSCVVEQGPTPAAQVPSR